MYIIIIHICIDIMDIQYVAGSLAISPWKVQLKVEALKTEDLHGTAAAKISTEDFG